MKYFISDFFELKEHILEGNTADTPYASKANGLHHFIRIVIYNNDINRGNKTPTNKYGILWYFGSPYFTVRYKLFDIIVVQAVLDIRENYSNTASP